MARESPQQAGLGPSSMTPPPGAGEWWAASASTSGTWAARRTALLQLVDVQGLVQVVEGPQAHGRMVVSMS